MFLGLNEQKLKANYMYFVFTRVDTLNMSGFKPLRLVSQLNSRLRMRVAIHSPILAENLFSNLPILRNGSSRDG